MPPAQVVAGPRVAAGEGAGRCRAAFSAGRLDLSPCGEEFSPLCVLERIGGVETRITRSHPIPFPSPGRGFSSPRRASKSRCLGRKALRGALGAPAQDVVSEPRCLCVWKERRVKRPMSAEKWVCP